MMYTVTLSHRYSWAATCFWPSLFQVPSKVLMFQLLS